MNSTTAGSGGGGNNGGLGILLQRLRAAVGGAYAPDTPDGDDGRGGLLDESGVTAAGVGDVEGVGLLAGVGGSSSSGAGGGGGLRSGGLLNAGGVGRAALRLLEGYGERRRRLVGRFKVGLWLGVFE